MVGGIVGFGVFVYLVVTASNAYMNVLGSPAVRGRMVMTIPTDTALGLLGVTATVLVALIASMWTSAQLPPTQSADSLGRQLVFIDVTIVTGGGSVYVGLAGALHGWGKDVNVVVSLAILGLSVALAYIAAEIGDFTNRYREIHQSLQSMAYRTKLDRLRNARRSWLQRSRRAGNRRTRRGPLARLRQNLGCLIAGALLQCAALLAWKGRGDLAEYLTVTLGGLVWSLILGQLMAHYGALAFVRREWSARLLTAVSSLLALAVNVNIALALALRLERTTSMPGIVAQVFAWLTMFGPLLLCVAGLTVAPTAWRRYRPMREVRWGVISALSRHIDKLSRSKSDEDSSARPGPLVVTRRRLSTAIRTATGVEPLTGSPAS